MVSVPASDYLTRPSVFSIVMEYADDGDVF